MNDLLTIAQAAERLQCSPDFIERRKVELRAIKLGRVYRIPADAVERFKAESLVPAPKKRVAPFRKTKSVNQEERRAEAERLWSRVLNKRRTA